MIIEDKVKLKMVKSKKKDKVYTSFFVSFSIQYTPILSRFKELHNVMILTPDSKIVLPKANLSIYSYYYSKKIGKKIPQCSISIPKDIAEELWNKGVRKLKVILELPDLNTPELKTVEAGQ